MNRRFYALSATLFVLTIVSACQIDVPYGSPYYTEPSGPVGYEQRENRALAIRLTVYPSTTERAATVNGKSPFGAMIGYPSYGVISFCSVSHLKKRKVALAAHCFKAYSDASDYYFIFFDRSGNKKITQAKKFLFRGDEDNDDVSIVQTDERADAWDSLDGDIIDTSAQVTEQLGDTKTDITIAAYDPERVNGESAMSYRERKGILFFPEPKADFYKDGVIKSSINFRRRHNTAYALFIDEISPLSKGGNSGALIFATGDSKKIYGVYDGSILPKDGWRYEYDEIRYRGTGAEKTSTTSDVNLFNYGATLEYVRKSKPELFN